MKITSENILDFNRLLGIDMGPPIKSQLDDIIRIAAEKIPWQNISMIHQYFRKAPSNKEIINNIISGKGGICLGINRFMLHYLKALGYNAQYILCSRKNNKRNHLALIVRIRQQIFFVDFGDAQPYYEALDISNPKEIIRGDIRFRISARKKDYLIERYIRGHWYFHYEFNLERVREVEIQALVHRYHHDIFYGPFWKDIHWAAYPEQKLRAIKNTTLIIESDDGIIRKHPYQKSDLLHQLGHYLNLGIADCNKIGKAFNQLRKINQSERFGLQLSDKEIQGFLSSIHLDHAEITMAFLIRFIRQVLSEIPFQNFKMIERGFGHIPTKNDIKEDMLSLRGGTCATMNTFLGCVLYSLGFDICLISGTMQKQDDHFALLLSLDNKKYVVDMGDGQPYFSPFEIQEKSLIHHHPFRTYRVSSSDVQQMQIEFLIQGEWKRDVTYHIRPQPFSFFRKTLENHYTKKAFGPFWRGLRYAIYPQQRLLSVRDDIIKVQQVDNTIKHISFNNVNEFKQLLTQYEFICKKELLQCYQKLKTYDITERN